MACGSISGCILQLYGFQDICLLEAFVIKGSFASFLLTDLLAASTNPFFSFSCFLVDVPVVVLAGLHFIVYG